MKKLVIFTLAVYYFAITCGVVINLHYCMHRLSSTTLFYSQNDTCDRCGMDIHESNGCCRDEVEIVKLDDDQNKTEQVAASIAALEPVEGIPSTYIDSPFQNIPVERHFRNHSPPLLSKQDTYIDINVFRI